MSVLNKNLSFTRYKTCGCGIDNESETLVYCKFHNAAFDMFKALEFIASQRDLTFAECSIAEAINQKAREAIEKAV